MKNYFYLLAPTVPYARYSTIKNNPYNFRILHKQHVENPKVKILFKVKKIKPIVGLTQY